MALDRYDFFQQAFFVEDLHASISEWDRLFGAGPFVLSEHHRTDSFDYRGTDHEADVSYAFGYLGDTMILSAATASKRPKDNLDFFPLTVDVEERMYAAGRIPGSFFRREGRPSEDAILTCRLTDRPLRPSFKKGLRNEIQIVSTVLSLDPDHLYDVLAINSAACSVLLSGLPFTGPVGATASRTASRSLPSWSIVAVSGAPRPERPCERWS